MTTYVITDKVTKSCNGCKFLHDMHKTLRENERLTGTSIMCEITHKLLYHDDYYIKRPEECPLVSRKRLENIIVSPFYGNAWEFIEQIFEVARYEEN